MSRPHHVHLAQRGAASLVVVLLLFFLMMLASAYAARGLVFEQRSSVNDYRAAQAAEAAEAGLAWTLALLNGGRIGDDCQPTVEGTQAVFRDRYLRVEGEPSMLKTRLDSTTTVAGCVRGAEGWSCQCPSSGLPMLDGVPPADGQPSPAFGVRLRALEGDFVELSVSGCSGADRRCLPGSARSADAVAERRAVVSLRAPLQWPIAAYTSASDLVLPSAAVQFVNRDPAGSGLAVHTRGSYDAPSAQALGVPGTPTAVASDDLQLPGEANVFFTAFFGLPKASFQRLPANRSPCGSSDCSAALDAAWQAGHRSLWVSGDLNLAPGSRLGSANEPVLLVVDGNLALSGDAQLHGLVYARGLSWHGAGTDAFIRGALVVEGPCCDITGTPAIVRDAEVLSRLRLASASWLQVPGSWLDKQP